MDRFGAVTPWKVDSAEGDRVELNKVHPKRDKLIQAIGQSLQSGSGPIVITGEPGSGKTWLCEAVASTLSDGFRILSVDLSPAVGPIEFHRLIQHRLGLDISGDLDIASARASIENLLGDCAADGSRWILAVEEAHNASLAVIEELRILENRRGRPEGFWGTILIGQTALARRLDLRPFASFASRIGGRVHLRTFDVVEFAESIRISGSPKPSHSGDSSLERKIARPVEAPATPQRAHGFETPIEPTEKWQPPVIAVGRPPLDEGEGMIEVGWESSAESADDGDSASRAYQESADSDSAVESEESDDLSAFDEMEERLDIDEPVEDHYTALQAWNEWSKRQGRLDEDDAESSNATIVRSSSPESSEQPSGPMGSPRPGGESSGTFWAEDQQEFAPYSQLFARFKKNQRST